MAKMAEQLSSIKRIEIMKGEFMEYDLNQYRYSPVKDWPHVLKMDFLLTISIFSNLNLIPRSSLIPFSAEMEKVDADLMDLLEF
jgi:hypothetical protein